MKILILTCSTGGGHNSCAKYIKDELDINNINCDILDYLSLESVKTSKKISKMYLDTTKGNGGMFGIVYKIGCLFNKTNILSPVYKANRLLKNKLYNYIKNNNYDLCICTHLFPSMCLTEINKEHDINFINIVTDYECAPFWNETKPKYYVIPNKLLIDRFKSFGIDESILLPFGIPIASNIDKYDDSINDSNYILLTSGSMGFGCIDEIAIKLLNNTDKNIIVICGNNKKLRERLERINNNRLKVLGFVNNMNEYIDKALIVVAKPGGLNSTEITTLRKPLVLLMPIPGVENYNVLFFKENNLALTSKNMNDVINNVNRLLNDVNLQNELINSQKKIINKNSAKDLVEFIRKEYKI